MTEGFAFEELSAVLDRFPLERAGRRPLDQVREAQVQLLLARIAALTDGLRRVPSHEAAHLASRLLLRDLSEIAAHFRGHANVTRLSLAGALTQLVESLSRCQALAVTDGRAAGAHARDA